MNNPQISIIIPIYNAEKTLVTCIQKIIEQTYSNWELLLINDGSKDRSLEICLKVQQIDVRIKTIDQPNGGASSARNAGLKAATGEWITFCDSDDYVGPYWLQNFVDMIQQNPDNQTLFIQKINIYKQGIFDSIYYEQAQGIMDKSTFLSGHFGFVWNKIFKREIISNQHITFDTQVKLFEDELFVLTYLSHIKRIVVCHQAPQYFYEWPIYTDKYQKFINNISVQLRIYQLSKAILSTQPNGYHVLIYKFLNRLMSKTILTLSAQNTIDDETLNSIIQITHEDIGHILRRKLFALRFLSGTNRTDIWKALLYGHAYLIRWHLLKL